MLGFCLVVRERGCTASIPISRIRRCGPTTMKTHDGLQAIEHATRDQLFKNPPTKHTLELSDAAVDDAAAQAGVDHLQLQRLGCKRSERGDLSMSVELLQQPHGLADVIDFAGGLAIFAVVLPDESPVAGQEFDDR